MSPILALTTLISYLFIRTVFYEHEEQITRKLRTNYKNNRSLKITVKGLLPCIPYIEEQFKNKMKTIASAEII